MGAFTGSYSNIRLRGWMTIDGRDSSYGQCAESGGEDLYGIAHRGTVTLDPPGPPSVIGAPTGYFGFADHAEAYDTTGLRWDILQDPNFPVDYHDVIPNFGTLPADEYPIVRVSGNLRPTAGHSGRGVLIVPGTLDLQTFGFYLEGIILAGDIASSSGVFGFSSIRGMLIGGLDGTSNSLDLRLVFGPSIAYDVCSTLAASNALAYWEPLENTLEDIQ